MKKAEQALDSLGSDKINTHAFALVSEVQNYFLEMGKASSIGLEVKEGFERLTSVVEEALESSQSEEYSVELKSALSNEKTILERLFVEAGELASDPGNAEVEERLKGDSEEFIETLRSMITLKSTSNEEDELLQTAEIVLVAVNAVIESSDDPDLVIQKMKGLTVSARKLFPKDEGRLFDVHHKIIKHEWVRSFDNIRETYLNLLKVTRDVKGMDDPVENMHLISDFVKKSFLGPVKEFLSMAKLVAHMKYAERMMKSTILVCRDAADAIPEGEELKEIASGSARAQMITCLKEIGASAASLVETIMALRFRTTLLMSARTCSDGARQIAELLGECELEGDAYLKIIDLTSNLKHNIVKVISYAKLIKSEQKNYSNQIYLADAGSAIGRIVKEMSEILIKGKDYSDEKAAEHVPDAAGDEHVNIWEEAEDDSKIIQRAEDVKGVQKMQIVAANLNRLVMKLTAMEQDLQFSRAFITTYRSFTTPEMLLLKLKERFLNPKLPPPRTDGGKMMMDGVCLRVCKNLKIWIETYFNDFTTEMLAELDNFIDVEMIPRGYNLPSESIRKAIGLKREANQEQVRKSIKETAGNSEIIDIFRQSVDDVAQHLTAIDYGFYKAVQPYELLGGAWAKDDKHKRSPNLMKMIDRFNAVSQWTASSIVEVKKLSDRAHRKSFFIRIARKLKELNNFHTLQAILSGLSNSAVYRLKHTQNEQPKDLTKALDELTELMSSSKSFSAFRKALHTCNPPTIPYIGIYLTDLTFIEDGNDDFLEKENIKLINFEKRILSHRVISEMQQYQLKSASYKLETERNLLDSLQNLQVLDNSELFRLSLECEPRDVSKSDLK